MSDFAALGPDGEARGASVRRADSRAGNPSDRLLLAVIGVAALAALAAAAILVLPSALRVTRYEVSGNAALSREEVLSAALIHEKEFFFAVDSSRVEAALEAQPRIAEARVTKVFPDCLRIAVRERVPVASAFATIEGRPAAVCLDDQGVAFAEACPDEASSVPVISGIRFEGFRPGTRLPPAVARLLAAMGEVRAKDPALLSAVSEIRIVTPAASEGSAPADAEPEILIYPMQHRIPVRAGASLDAATLRSMILVLDVLGTKGIADKVREIDFRSGRVVYSTKEGQPG